VALTDAAFVFAEVNVQTPMQRVFDTPMAANVRQQLRGIVGRQVADVVVVLDGSFFVGSASRLDANEAAKVFPFSPLGKPGDVRGMRCLGDENSSNAGGQAPSHAFKCDFS